VKKLFYAVLILGLLVVSLTVHGQSVIDQYGPKIPSEKRIEVTKYHFWQARFNGTKWSDEQKAFLEKAALDPLSIKYEEQAATRLFTSDQLKDVFFKIGSFDTSILKAMYHANVRSDKTVLLRSLSMADKGNLWRPWLAYWATTHVLTADQINHFDHFSQFFYQPSKEAAAALEKEAIAVFGLETAKEIYGPIGPYTEVGQMCQLKSRPAGGPSAKSAALPAIGNCGCSYGSSFNWSCSSECQTATHSECTHQDDGCGFAGLFACDGKCTPSEGN
jgi:hypothetical protein